MLRPHLLPAQRPEGQRVIDPAARGAWKELETRLRPFIARRVASEADVDDVVQDVFLRMQRSVAELRDEERFGPWVYQVARSAIAEHGRSAARHPLAHGTRRESDEPAREPDADDRTLDEPTRIEARAIEQASEPGTLEERDLAQHVAPFVALLPSPYREALTLVELELRFAESLRTPAPFTPAPAYVLAARCGVRSYASLRGFGRART